MLCSGTLPARSPAPRPAFICWQGAHWPEPRSPSTRERRSGTGPGYIPVNQSSRSAAAAQSPSRREWAEQGRQLVELIRRLLKNPPISVKMGHKLVYIRGHRERSGYLFSYVSIEDSNKTHRSGSDPDALLARKSNAYPALPSPLAPRPHHRCAVICDRAHPLGRICLLLCRPSPNQASGTKP